MGATAVLRQYVVFDVTGFAASCDLTDVSACAGKAKPANPVAIMAIAVALSAMTVSFVNTPDKRSGVNLVPTVAVIRVKNG
jgi:hypothetical protein